MCIPVSVLSDKRTTTIALTYLRLCALRLQLGIALAYRHLQGGETEPLDQSAVQAIDRAQTKEQAFLSEVSSVPLQQSLRHLADAFTNFFEGRAGYPTFKARHDKQSAEYTRAAFSWDGHVLRLAKMEDPLYSLVASLAGGSHSHDCHRLEGYGGALFRLHPR